MKTITLSNRFYYHELDEKDASAIKNDLVLYNSMLHNAYKLVSLKNKGVYIKSNDIHKELKCLYGTNDYFPQSIIWKAQALLKANHEHHQLFIKQKKQQLKRIETKITEKQKKIKRIDKQIQKLIEKTKAGKQTEKDYLKEVQVLKPQKKCLKNQMSQLIFKKNRILQIMERPMRYCCFGGRKLDKLRTTVNLSHEQWYKEYHHARNHLISVCGRRQGKYSNNLFKYHVDEDYMIYRCSSEKREIKLNIKFHHDAEHLIKAVKLPHNTPGKAVQYDLIDYGEYFIIKAVVEVNEEPVEFNRSSGAVGIDINADHIALCETDRHGNCVLLKTIPMNLTNKSRNQRKHIIRNAAKKAVLESVRSNKPFIIESLDFKQKKMNMRYENKSRNRTLSEFAYKEITETMKSRCRKDKAAYKEINPAYTSRIARDKYMKSMGCSIHMAASYVIARRGCGYRDTI
ncbi:MAG: IS200/IS605 family accessory protein TnpB-related protein [Erysipelotrichaceae bacterium]|nr:IS200/IS605 family accessory protein TnpB-related protein [Erysipelotrichaceae bacterium]